MLGSVCQREGQVGWIPPEETKDNTQGFFFDRDGMRFSR